MLMGIRDFLAPTRGRILLFVILFVLIILYDTAFAPFPGSPLAENLSTQDGAASFVLYMLVLPYILSCLIPAFAGLRKKRFLRLSRLSEFMHPRHTAHTQKLTKQQHFVFPAGTPVEESKPVSQAAPAPSQPEPAKTPKKAVKHAKKTPVKKKGN